MPQRGPAAGLRCGVMEAADAGVRLPSATGRQSSIGPMSESAGEAARFLTRNAVDALPEGRLEKQLAEGKPLRAKLGIDPTAPDIHLGHTVVLRKLREFQDLGHTVVLIVGDYTARVGDPSGRSATRPQLDGARDRRQRRDLQGPGLRRARPGPHRGPLQRRVARHAHRGPVPPGAHRHRRPAARAGRLRQAVRRRASRSRCSSCSTRCSRATTRSPSDADVELGGTDQKFNLLLARDIQQDYGKQPQSILTMPILPGTDGVQKMSKSLGNYVGVTEPAEEIFGKLMRVPDADDARLLRPAAGRAVRSGSARGGVQAGDGARRWPRGSRARTRRGQPRRTSTACTWRARRPTEIEEYAFAANGGNVHVPGPACATRSAISSSEARRLLAQGGVRLDGEPVGVRRDRPPRGPAGGGGAAGRQAPLPPDHPGLRIRPSVLPPQRYTRRSRMIQSPLEMARP